MSGVYGGMTDPLPMMVLFDKQIQVRMGQANVKRWIDDILPLVSEADVLHVEDFASHHLPLEDAPKAYEIFQKKQDGAVKVISSGPASEHLSPPTAVVARPSRRRRRCDQRGRASNGRAVGRRRLSSAPRRPRQ